MQRFLAVWERTHEDHPYFGYIGLRLRIRDFVVTRPSKVEPIHKLSEAEREARLEGDSRTTQVQRQGLRSACERMGCVLRDDVQCSFIDVKAQGDISKEF